MIRAFPVVARASPHVQGLLLIGLGVVFISFDSLLIRLLAQTLSFADIIFWRGVGTAIGFLALALTATRDRPRLAFAIVDRLGLLVASLTVVGNALFVTAITHTTVAHALLILSVAPILTAILSQLILGEQASRSTWLACIVVAVGLGLIFVAIPGPGRALGDVASLCGAFFFSLLVVVLRHARSANMIPALALGGALTAVVAAPFVTRFWLSPREIALVLVVGVATVPVSLALILRGLRNVRAPEVSLLLLLETILGPLWVLIALREFPDLRTILSGSVILLGLISGPVTAWRHANSQQDLATDGVKRKPDRVFPNAEDLGETFPPSSGSGSSSL